MYPIHHIHTYGLKYFSTKCRPDGLDGVNRLMGISNIQISTVPVSILTIKYSKIRICTRFSTDSVIYPKIATDSVIYRHDRATDSATRNPKNANVGNCVHFLMSEYVKNTLSHPMFVIGSPPGLLPLSNTPFLRTPSPT